MSCALAIDFKLQFAVQIRLDRAQLQFRGVAPVPALGVLPRPKIDPSLGGSKLSRGGHSVLIKRLRAIARRWRVASSGSGTPIVFVHPALADLRVWDTLRSSVAKTHRFVAYNQRYFGTAAWPDKGERFAKETQVEDLTAFIRGVGRTRVLARLVDECGYGAAGGDAQPRTRPHRLLVRAWRH